MTAHSFDPQRVRQAFNAAAGSYDEAAVLQREVLHRLMEALLPVRHRPEVILDAGCGTGEAYPLLHQRYPKVRIIALDIAENMLQHARQRGGLLHKPWCVCADIEQLPLADNSVDMVFSNLALQWVNDLPATLAGFARVLKPGGLLMFSSFGPDTLKELRQCWREVDDAVHVNAFIDMHDIGDALLQAGLADPVMSAEHIVMTYTQARLLMQDLRDIGANATARGHRQGLLTAAALKRVCQAYEQFRRSDGLPATYEVLYGHAWKPSPALKPDAAATEVTVQLRRQRPQGGE